MMSGGGDGPVEEKVQTEFDVIMTSAGQKKISVIKVIKDIIGLGLKESKDFVDNLPRAVKEKVSEAEANEIKEKLEAEGATLEIK
jgi:large subunit ribosomal protein L7/L12